MSKDAFYVPPSSQLALAFKRYPLTLILVAFNLLTFPVGWLSDLTEPNTLLQWMLLSPLRTIDSQLYFLPIEEVIRQGEWWRLLTPMLLHFNFLHLIFNLLWIWDLGRRIELGCSKLTLFMVTLISSVLANVGQYALVGPSIFGGMSGVVFGFFGFCLVWDGRVLGQRSGLNRAIYLVIIVFMLLGFTGLLDFLVGGAIANGAHVGGFIGGMLFALLLRLSGRWPAFTAHC